MAGSSSSPLDLNPVDVLTDSEPEALEDHARGGEHRRAMELTPIDGLAKGAPGLYRMLENLFLKDVDPKHRRLRLGNAALRERVLNPLPGAFELLQFVGYSSVEEGGDTWLLLETERHNPTLAKQEASWLRGLVERRWQPSAWPCPICTLQNGPGAANCGACEGPRPEWAAGPAAPKPSLGAPACGRPKAGPPRERPEQSAPVPGASPEQRQQVANVIHGARAERLRERERILAEARADRERFDAVGPQTPQRASAEEASVAAELPEEGPSLSGARGLAAIRLRLPDGSVVEEAFAAADLLEEVFKRLDAVTVARGEPVEDYALLRAFPRRVFYRELLGRRSLGELGLSPSSTLSVLRAEDRGRVQSGNVETALLTGDIEGLSYEELQELESRIGDAKLPTRTSKRTLDSLTTIHKHGEAPEASDSAAPVTSCSICFLDYKHGELVRTLRCGHAFHVACVDRWFAEKEECPVCRVAVQPQD